MGYWTLLPISGTNAGTAKRKATKKKRAANKRVSHKHSTRTVNAAAPRFSR